MAVAVDEGVTQIRYANLRDTGKHPRSLGVEEER
jgi:hypothetical protein